MTTTPEQQDDAPTFYTGFVANGPEFGKTRTCVGTSYEVLVPVPVRLTYMEAVTQSRPDYYRLRYEWHPLEGQWRLDIPSQRFVLEFERQQRSAGQPERTGNKSAVVTDGEVTICDKVPQPFRPKGA